MFELLRSLFGREEVVPGYEKTLAPIKGRTGPMPGY